MDDLKRTLAHCLQLRETLGDTIDGVKQPWTALDAEIDQLREMIADEKRERRWNDGTSHTR